MKKVFLASMLLMATGLFARRGVHMQNDSQLNAVYFVSLIGILILRTLYRLITKKNQDLLDFYDLMGPVGLSFLITLIFWILR